MGTKVPVGNKRASEDNNGRVVGIERKRDSLRHLHQLHHDDHGLEKYRRSSKDGIPRLVCCMAFVYRSTWLNTDGGASGPDVLLHADILRFLTRLRHVV